MKFPESIFFNIFVQTQTVWKKTFIKDGLKKRQKSKMTGF